MPNLNHLGLPQTTNQENQTQPMKKKPTPSRIGKILKSQRTKHSQLCHAVEKDLSYPKCVEPTEFDVELGHAKEQLFPLCTLPI
jgi:hypothetical protein